MKLLEILIYAAAAEFVHTHKAKWYIHSSNLVLFSSDIIILYMQDLDNTVKLLIIDQIN